MNDASQCELVERARAGDVRSLELLTVEVQRRVCAYANRVLLNSHEAEDLAQDTVTAILGALGNFRQVDRFWPWVFTIASNEVRQRFRRQSRRKVVPISNVDEMHLQSLPDADEGGEAMARQELAELTRQAMSKVGQRHRMVLALRFYEDMPHAEIARALGCTEMGARVVFHRAKLALLRELKRLGVNKTMLTAALAAFGGATLARTASAVVVVSSGALTEGLTGWLRGKLGWPAAAALLLVATLWMAGAHSDQTGSGGSPPAYVHFVHQSLIPSSADITFGQSKSKGAYEQWFRFPKGLGGPMVFRMQRWNPEQTQKLCWWVENEDGNYYVHSGERKIYISNGKMFNSNYSTRTLPTDSKETCDFVRQVEESQGKATIDEGITTDRDPKTGRLIRRVDTRFAELGPFVTTYDYSPQELSLWDAPSGMTVVDQRDAMHQRGWVHFRVEGQLGGKPITGRGQLPFVYRELTAHPPWLQLELGGRAVALDDGRQAMLIDGKTQKPTSYAAGGLFRGLSRPWTGFHTLDTIRRDAAEEKLWFSTRVIDGSSLVHVSVVKKLGAVSEVADYAVDVEHDLLHEVKFWLDSEKSYEALGELRFVYLDLEDSSAQEFNMPKAEMWKISKNAERPSLFWPLQLIQAAITQQSTVQ